MKGQMEGKVALITGGSSGIGKATAIAFARAGAKVAIASRWKSKAEEAMKDIKEFCKDATWIQVDLANESFVSSMVQKVVDIYG